MTDKVQKIHEEVERLQNELIQEKKKGFGSDVDDACIVELQNVLTYIDSLQEEPVSEKKCIFTKDSYTNEDRKVLCEDCKEKCEYNKKEEPASEELGEYINKLSKQFPEVSFAKLSRIAVMVAKWHNEHLWKHADGNSLPIIDREVIALLDNGKVVFAHRPPEYWDGKNIITGKVTRNYPKTYDKGGWNIPNIKYWLDCLMPKEIEL